MDGCCAETVVQCLNNRVFSLTDLSLTNSKDIFWNLQFSHHCYTDSNIGAMRIRDRRYFDGYFLQLAKRIMHMRFVYHLSYVEAEERLSVCRPSLRIAKERQRWVEHVLRNEDSVLRKVLHFTPSGGARGRGRPRYRYYDTVKQDITERSIEIGIRYQTRFWNELFIVVDDRNLWRSTVVEWGR